MKNKIQILTVIFFLAFLLLIFFINKKVSNNSEIGEKTIQIKLGQEIFTAEIVEKQKDQEKGLSNRQNLCHECAMLFLFNSSARRNFWMKDMRFDVDIIWIQGDKIVGISPQISYEKGEKEIVNSVVDIDKAIEINAGTVKRLGLKVGDKIK